MMGKPLSGVNQRTAIKLLQSPLLDQKRRRHYTDPRQRSDLLPVTWPQIPRYYSGIVAWGWPFVKPHTCALL